MYIAIQQCLQLYSNVYIQLHISQPQTPWLNKERLRTKKCLNTNRNQSAKIYSVTADQNKIFRLQYIKIILLLCGLSYEYVFKLYIHHAACSNTTQALAAHFDFTIFLSRPFFLVPAFTVRVFWLKISQSIIS